MSPRRRLLALHRFHHIFANLAYKTAWVSKNKRNFTTIMGEWQALYGAVPPESSLLLRKYRQMYRVAAPGRRLLRSGRTTA